MKKLLGLLLLVGCAHNPFEQAQVQKTEPNIYGIDIEVSCVHKRADGNHDVYFGYNNPGEEKFIFHSRFNRVTPVAYHWWGGAPLWTYQNGKHDKAFVLAGLKNLDIVRWQLGNHYADINERTPACENVTDQVPEEKKEVSSI